MRKDDLRDLVTQMYENLLEKIDLEENADKKQVINYLKDSINIFSDITEHRLESIEKAKLAFTDEYKELTHRTLKAYNGTNLNFKKLASIHESAIEECHDEDINVPEVADKFTNIQTQMTDEIHKANQIINQLTKQVKNLEQTSNIDALTKVYNRRALTSYLTDICAKKGIPYELHLLILDIDDFKIINDQYGHIAGDKILIFIANIFRKTLRDGDRIFRYGGEEFIIILNRTNDSQCQSITHRLLTLIQSNKLIYKGKNLRVTMSIGTTKYVNSDTPDSLIARADKALYRAKDNGKNQICTEI